MLTSRKARVNGPAFVLGWLAGLGIVGAIVLAVAGAGSASKPGSPATWVSWVKIALGVLLLLVAVRQFRGRPRGDEQPQRPKWMATIDKTTPVAAVGLAAVLSGANPKNLLLAVGGAAAIAGTGIPGSQQAIGVLDSVLLIYRVSRPHVAVLGEIPGSGGQWADTAVHSEDQTVPGVTVLRVEAGLFFANADYVRTTIENAAAANGTRAVVLDCQTTPSVDVTAARMLNELAADLARRGVRLVLAGEIGQVREMVVAGQGQTPEYHRTVTEAVQAAQARPAAKPAEER